MDIDEGEAALADIPFESLQKLRGDGTGVQKFGGKKKKNELARENKNMPMQLPIHRQVPRFRLVVEAPKKERRDPRFESLCGELDEKKFHSAYDFLYSEQMPAELQTLKRRIKKERNPIRKEEMREELKSLGRTLSIEKQRKMREKTVKEAKEEETKAVEKGKKPFYLKKSEVRKQELITKYKELKASGKLESFLAKRRKKNASKEHVKVPYRRE